jgi:hypothetical protein
MQMFEKKQKIIERMTSMIDGSNIKLSLAEGLINQHSTML